MCLHMVSPVHSLGDANTGAPTLLCHRKAEASTFPSHLIKDAKSLEAEAGRSQKLAVSPYGLASRRGWHDRCIGSQLQVTQQILFLQANNVKLCHLQCRRFNLRLCHAL